MGAELFHAGRQMDGHDEVAFSVILLTRLKTKQSGQFVSTFRVVEFLPVLCQISVPQSLFTEA